MIKKSFSFIPHYTFYDLTGVTPVFLTGLGIRFLMLDLDNTIAAYDEHTLPERAANWAADIKNSGIELFIVSNSTRTKRVETFARQLGAGFVLRSKKPSPNGIFRAMEESGFSAAESAFAGDQIFTDTLAARRAGVISILVRPVRFTNPFLALRYYIEQPVRVLCKNKVKEQART